MWVDSMREIIRVEDVVKSWNKRHEIGIDVEVESGIDSLLMTRTLSEAILTKPEYGHEPLIQVEGIHGWCSLYRVTPR